MRVPHREGVHLGDIRSADPDDAVPMDGAVVVDLDRRAGRSGQQAGKLPSTARSFTHSRPLLRDGGDTYVQAAASFSGWEQVCDRGITKRRGMVGAKKDPTRLSHDPTVGDLV
jgi:hypothetical protein